MMTSTELKAGERLSGRLAAMATIGLDDLNGRAALLTRTDRKYVLGESSLAPLLDALGGVLAVLEIDGERQFGYRSTYFDTPDRSSYKLAAYGRRRRFKVRTRLYIDTAQCWLEVKTRGPGGVTIKQRTPHPIAAHEVLTDAGSAFVETCLTAASVASVDVPLLAPALTTSYRRSTLLVRGKGARVTVDRNLSWALPQGPVLRAPDVVILETKSGPGRLSEVDRALWALGHRPMRVSKFGTGLSLFHEDLPANKWQRVVRKHLENLTITFHETENPS